MDSSEMYGCNMSGSTPDKQPASLSTIQYKAVELYGGAMHCNMPLFMEDVSVIRQVPDNQEVHNDTSTGATLIIELLARQENVTNSNAAQFFYYDLAKDNGCTNDQVDIESTCQLPPSAYPHLNSLPAQVLCSAVARDNTNTNTNNMSNSNETSPEMVFACLTSGHQQISKYTNEKGKENDIHVTLAVLRLPRPVSTEILVSLSAPVRIHAESSEARVIERLLTPQERNEILRTAISTLEVNDWNLFVME